jgi:very-short-patch-repair endonuclease
MREADQRAGRIAARQHGLVALRQAREAGLTDRQVRARVASGRWQPVRARVYRLNGHRPSWTAAVHAAVLAAGPDAVASHRSAALLHGLRQAPAPDLHEVTVPAPRHPRLGDVAVHRTLALPDRDRCRVRGVPCTTGARTLVDLAALLDRDALTALVDEAVFDQVVARGVLHGRALAMAGGRGGVDLLVRLTAPGAAPVFRSWLEREGDRVLRAGRLPAPRWNVSVEDRRGVIGIVDASWRAERVVLELDGLRFHASDEQWRKDRGRDRRLALAGWRVLRYTWLDVRQRPAALVAEVAEALGVRMAP